MRVDVAREVRAHRLWMGSAVAARAEALVVRQKAEEDIILLAGNERLDKKRRGNGEIDGQGYLAAVRWPLVGIPTVSGEFGWEMCVCAPILGP